MKNLILLLLVLNLPFSYHCREFQKCGKLPSGQLPNKTQAPWAVHLVHADTSVRYKQLWFYPGVLVSPNVVLLSARTFYHKEGNKEYTFNVLNYPEPFVAVFNNNVKINVSHLSLHPTKTSFTECTNSTYEFVIAHLNSSVDIDEAIQPVCIHRLNNNQYKQKEKEKHLYGLQWTWTLRHTGFKVSHKTINLTDDFSETNCKNISKVFSKSQPARLQCSRDSGEVSSLQVAVWGGHQIKIVSTIFTCSNSTCFLEGLSALLINRLFGERCAELFDGSLLSMWPLDHQLVNWIENNEKCGKENFTCVSNGKCIQKSKLCDYKSDCPNCSDENPDFCENPYKCKEGEFTCNVYGECIPSSKVGDGVEDCLSGDDEAVHTATYVIVSLVCAFFVALIIVGLVYFYLRIRRLKERIRDLTDEEMNEFFNGSLRKRNFSLTESESLQNEESGYKFPLYVNNSLQTKPWDDIFEIPTNHLEIREILGQGEFGIVNKAKLKSINETNGDFTFMDVAVKAQLPNMEVEDFKSLLREVKIMSHVGCHEYIVSFIGACTRNIKKRQVHLVIEFCAVGNLLNFLRSLSKSCFSEDFSSSAINNNYSSHTNVNTRSPVQSDFFKWVVQVARGMVHLGNKNVVHGDLAARNILLTANLDAKVSDFGLSRELNDTNIYVKSTQQAIPWKWLALESIASIVFSYKTDVWAFGVTLWEIFSLGGIPYGEIPFTPEFLMRLKEGNRLARPEFASTKIYDILLTTWNADPDKRPSFLHLENSFVKIHETIKNKP